jgi:hypothetical protein
MSALTWIDSSNAEAERVRRVLALFNRPEARDELGLGAIRDTLADLLFPGTSTIQTRLRYMLFIPWLYSQINPRADAVVVAAELRRLEGRLIDALRLIEDEIGIIGVEAGVKVHRLASAVYWGGLGSWRIRTFGGSQATYHRLRSGMTTQAWARDLPDVPDKFPDKATLKLSNAEKAYLHDQIAVLRSHDEPAYLSLVTQHGGAGADWPWTHPAQARLASGTQRLLRHARLFAAVMFGATLLYNVLLARVCEFDNVDEYEQDFNDWAAGEYPGAEFAVGEIQTWSLDELRHVAVHPSHKIVPAAWEFVGRWVQLARGDRVRLLQDRGAADLITLRERRLKQSRARLSEPEARAGWGGASGYAPLNYRWPLVQRYLADFAAA